MTEQEHTEDVEDLRAEIERLQRALQIAGINIVRLNEHSTKLNNALNTGCQLIDYLVADLAAAGLTPTVALRAAKQAFDADMKVLLGEKIFAKIGKPRFNPKAN